MEYHGVILFLYSVCLLATTTSGESLENEFINHLAHLNISGDADDKCRADLIQMAEDLIGLKAYAWQMLDATSKIRSGISLIADDIGQYDLCLRAKKHNGSITGKYCLGGISFHQPPPTIRQDLQVLPNTKVLMKNKTAPLTASTANHPFTWAACLPSSCSAYQFGQVFNNLPDHIFPFVNFHFQESQCYSANDDTALSTGAIVTIVFFSLILLIMVLSTCYDLYAQHFSIEKNPWFLAFSMYTNTKKLFVMNKTNALECLNGLKFYSMLWVIWGHTYSLGLTAPSYNYLDVLAWIDKLYSMILISGPLSVDTFFIVGGVLVCYVYMQSMEKGHKFNIIVYYFHRFVRLTPALAAMVLTATTLLQYLGSGPTWYLVKVNQKMCQDYWWASVFYFQNYLSSNELCAGHTWYLAIDMQLYLLSPLILYPLRRFPKYTLIAVSAVIAGICGMDFGLAWSNKYLALLSNIHGDNLKFQTDFYMKTHTKANAWLTGVIAGYIIHQLKQKKISLKLHKMLVCILWLCCLALLLVCIFIGHDSLRTADYNQWGNSLHIGFIRQIWAFGICWLIIACVTGNGGVINWILTWPIYQVFNRFAYSIYLVHYLLITLWYAEVRSPIFFSDMTMMYNFWGNLCFSCLVSYFWVLAFESPVIILEKLLLKKLGVA